MTIVNRAGSAPGFNNDTLRAYMDTTTTPQHRITIRYLTLKIIFIDGGFVPKDDLETI
jgi:hypothetical protein